MFARSLTKQIVKMKKFTLLLSMFLFLAATAVTFTSCDKDDDDDQCVELIQAASDASVAYSSNTDDAAACNAYKDAINAVIDGCDDLTDEEIVTFEFALAFLDCDDL